MTYEQYWYGDVWMVASFREAEQRRKERKNRELHLLGMYIYEAFCDASPLFHDLAKPGTKAIPYRTEPYLLAGEKERTPSREEKEQKEEAERLRALLYMKNMVRESKNWGKTQPG